MKRRGWILALAAAFALFGLVMLILPVLRGASAPAEIAAPPSSTAAAQETEEVSPEQAEPAEEATQEQAEPSEEAVPANETETEAANNSDAEISAEPDPDRADSSALDYADPENWAFFDEGEERDVDVFLVAATVDTRSKTNALDLNDQLKERFRSALERELGIYGETGRVFSPYYRQMSINAYMLPENERHEPKQIAFRDVADAFRWYLEHENNGRGIILAGFSQGAEMCLELLKEFYGGEGDDAQALRDRLVAVYAVGWALTEEMTEAYPQIVPASGETDTGTVISFDCEDGSLNETLIIPLGVKALSINPLNWVTDATPADRSLNRGALVGALTGSDQETVPELCGAYIGERGELVVTGVSADDYPPVLNVFPEGAFHLYDEMFFFTNLKDNVADRTAAWLAVQAAVGEAQPAGEDALPAEAESDLPNAA